MGNTIQSIPFVDANQDDDACFCPGSAVHASGLRIPIPPISDGKSPRLSYLLGEILETRRKTQEQAFGQTVTETDTSLDRKVTAFPSPSRVKLFSLLVIPSVLRQSRKLLVGGDLCSSCFFVVYPDVCLKQDSGTMFRTFANVEMA